MSVSTTAAYGAQYLAPSSSNGGWLSAPNSANNSQNNLPGDSFQSNQQSALPAYPTSDKHLPKNIAAIKKSNEKKKAMNNGLWLLVGISLGVTTFAWVVLPMILDAKGVRQKANVQKAFNEKSISSEKMLSILADEYAEQLKTAKGLIPEEHKETFRLAYASSAPSRTKNEARLVIAQALASHASAKPDQRVVQYAKNQARYLKAILNHPDFEKKITAVSSFENTVPVEHKNELKDFTGWADGIVKHALMVPIR